MSKTMTWDADADRALLMAILKTSNVTIDYAAVAAELSTDDISLSKIAVQRRMQKLKEKAGVPKGQVTPGRPGTKREVEEDDEAGETPALKKKRGKNAGKKAAKGKDDQGEAGAVKEEDAADFE
ncbi:hypothetical protein C1H76_1718 [Elsinoe australis]|uniref:Uncharacterized protein n=1 Tax=Elsinoe australis TaxID=40998 RepID=A0A4U7B7W0_9PEZI|nr:hypothetical protein C1H76_1718 [Elsinoe australis]